VRVINVLATFPDTGANVPLLTHDATARENPVVSVKVDDMEAALEDAAQGSTDVSGGLGQVGAIPLPPPLPVPASAPLPPVLRKAFPLPSINVSPAGAADSVAAAARDRNPTT